MKATTAPVSLRLDAGLLRKAGLYARRRKIGVTTALRMIISEHLEAVEAAEELDVAFRWQQERAWAALVQWEKGGAEERSLEDLRKTHEAALRSNS